MFEEDGNFVPYHLEESSKIEEAYQKKEKKVEFVEDCEDGASCLVRVDLEKMLEYRVDKPSETRKIQRNSAGGEQEHLHVFPFNYSLTVNETLK